MRNLGTLGLSILLLNGLLSPVAGYEPAKHLPKGSGVIGGRASVAIFPVKKDGPSGESEFLEPAGLEVHLTPGDESEVELVYPAASWFQPPPGQYRMWLQGDWRMTPFSLLMSYSSRATTGEMRVTMPLGEAGRVKLPAGADTAQDLALHLLHGGPYLEAGFPRWEISPQRAAAEVGEGVLMPVGRTIGAVWDRKARKYVALSRPFEVRARHTVEVPLDRPGSGAHLVAKLERPSVADSAAELEVELAVSQPDGERPPDVTVLTTDRVYAFWYDLAAGPAELGGGSKETYLERRQLDLRSGTIEHVTAEFRPLPALDVELDLPAPLRHEKPTLEIRRLPRGEVLERRDLGAAVSSLRFERLPAALLEVALQSAVGTFSRRVDLSSGKDGFLLLKPELITLAGTVFYGDEPHAAKLTFANAGGETVTETGEDGAYEVVVVDPVRTVSIELSGVDRAPYVDFFMPALDQSRDLDFHLPDGTFQARVLDAATGRGVPRATVDLRNGFFEESEDGGAGKREKAVFQSAVADDTGTALLPPMREGTLEIRASAKGYSRMREPLKAQVLDDRADQTFEIRLDPIGDSVAVHLLLPGGVPAAGADVVLLDSLASGRELFAAKADADGAVEPPRKQVGWLLVKHPAAGSSVRPWQPSDDEGELEWTLPPAADRPLTLRVTDGSGLQAAPRAEVAVWVEGRRLSGSTLAWLVGASPLADPNGYWIGRNLPPGPVSVLAWSGRAREDAWAGRLDAKATAVPYPWPHAAEIRAEE